MKNNLQEFWQKRGDILPTYATNRKGGSDHLPCFQSTVTLPNGDAFTSSVQKSKLLAEMNAAELASQSDNSYECEKVAMSNTFLTNNNNNNNTFVFVDLENIPSAQTLPQYIGFDNCLGIVSSKHHLASRCTALRVFVVNSRLKDAADYALAMTIALTCTSSSYKKYNRLIDLLF